MVIANRNKCYHGYYDEKISMNLQMIQNTLHAVNEQWQATNDDRYPRQINSWVHRLRKRI